MKDARLSLPLTEVMQTDRLTSPLLDAPCQSLPRPRWRHGRRLALLFHLGLTLNLYTLSFALSLALLPRLPPLLIFPNCSSPRELASVYAAYLRFHFSVSQPKAEVAEPEATSLSSAEPRAQRSLTHPLALPSHLLNFLQLPPTSPRPLPLVQTKLPIRW